MSLLDALTGDFEPPWDRKGPLTPVQVADIRELYHGCGWKQADIAHHFGVSQGYVSRIVNHKRRKS